MAAKGHFVQRFGILARLAPAAVSAVLTLALVALPALAQTQRRGSAFDSFFRPFSAPRYGPTDRPADSSRAPAPRKQDTQPADLVLVLGDSMADWLAYGLEDALSDTPEIGVVRKHRTVSGLIRYDFRNETIDWAEAAREAIAATKPKFIAMMVGLHDRQAIRVRPQPQSAPTPAGTAAPAAIPQSAAAATSPDAAQTPGPQAAHPSTESPAIIVPEQIGRASCRERV